MILKRWKDPRTKLGNVTVELGLNLARQAEARLMRAVTIC